jgi:hypothetical protein
VTGAQTDINKGTDGQEQGHRWTGTQTGTGAGTQRDRERDTNGHGQGYEHGHRQLSWTTYKKIRALKALSFNKFYKIEF